MQKFGSLLRSPLAPLSLRHLAVLEALCVEHPGTIRGLAADLEIGRPTATRLVANLIEWGFVESVRDGEDLRSVLLSPTSSGRTAVDQVSEILTGDLS